MAKKRVWLGTHWEMLGLTAVLFVLVAVFVELKPAVDENFFFSTSDPGVRESNKVEQRFPSQPQLILAVSSQDISSPRYLGRIQRLTQQLEAIDEVSAVKSLTVGPKSFQDALEGEFWRRLLIAKDRKSSNVIVFLENKDPEKPIKRIERIIHELDEKDFRIHIAGPPYVVEMIRRSLAHDFWYFSLTAVVLFGLTMAAMFRSARVFLGMLATCASAVLLTLLLQSIFGRKIGILTVNLGTIVFVVALSHLVYMTFNWQTLADRGHRLGKESPNLAADARRMTFPPSFWSMVCASLGFGSLLNSDAAYEKMWRLHGALENYKDVGTVISLPTLLAEGDRTPFSFLLSYEKMTEMMEQPKYARVAKSFVTKDRTRAMFLLRMVEERRDKYRFQVVDDLRGICRKYGFKPELVGGIYYLQGRLAQLVASSLVTGLFWLNLLFVVIAWIVARSVRGALAMIVSLTLVPLCMLGGIGWLRVPMDVISAPATNVCIGIAIDSMIHLVFGVRRTQREGEKGWAAWVAAREEQWRGIVYSDVIIAAGFAIFVLSDFPPTQRFGLVVLAGCIIDILANLFVLPLLGGAPLKKRV